MNNIIVNESSSNIKYLARQAMDGSWKKATIAVAMYLVCIMVPVLILEVLFGSLNPEYFEAAMNGYASEEIYVGSMISSIYTILVEGAFTFGVTLFFIQMIRSKKSDYGTIFSGFGYFFKTLGLYLFMSLFVFLWTMLFIVPGIIASIRYSQVFFILADDPSKGIRQCMHESKELMKGNKAKLFCLQLSFIPWMLLAYLVVLIVAVIGGVVTAFLPVVGVILIVIGMLVFLAALCVLVAYMMGATTVFYDMVTGRLRAARSLPPTDRESFDPWQQ